MVKIQKSFLNQPHVDIEMKDLTNLEKQKNILNKLKIYRKQDFSYKSGKILGSMCTQPHPIAKKAYMNFMETNLGDPALFPGSKKIEEKYIDFLKKILNAPKKSMGIIGSGGTEGNITAMWLAKKISDKNEIIVPENVHFSFEKIASMMNMKILTINLNDKYVVDIKNIKEKISEKTAAVVGIAGSTELGTVDDIYSLSKICKKNNIFLHVDAAFGGFVIPFLKKLGYRVNDFDFKLKGVDSVSLDAHKMGYSAIPLGTLVVRNKTISDSISVESHCVSTKKQVGILGTRSGGPVAAAYAVSEFLGENGYKNLVQKCMNVTDYAVKRIEDIGLNIIVKPTMNVIGIKLDNPSKVVKKLTDLKWKVNEMERISCIRLVLMPHVSKNTINSFIPDLKKVCKRL